MDEALAAVGLILIMLFLMLMGMRIVYALGLSALVVAFFTYGPASIDKLGWTTFTTLFNLNWIPLPLFVLLACLIAETTMGDNIYAAARAWLSGVPGGLIVTSIFGEAIMAASVGTSAACILAVGKVADKEFKKYGYDTGFSMGAMCCGGVIGPLIPPSAGFIIYGVLAEVSIGHLFMAGIIPGVFIAVLLAAAVIGISAWKPQLAPPIKGGVTWRERFVSLKYVWPMVIIMLAILGTIYLGIASPTEAAGVGCVVVLLLSVGVFRLRWAGLIRVLKATALLNGMILFMMVSAWLFAYVVGSSGVVDWMTGWAVDATFSRWWVIILINVMLLILGCFMDGITIMLLTIPLFVPVIEALGFSPIWFGVLYVVNIEIGLITPPMGLSLFMMRTAFDIDVNKLLKGVLPFVIVLLIALAVLIAVPDITLWLPETMKK